jgi:hypothetical protein
MEKQSMHDAWFVAPLFKGKRKFNDEKYFVDCRA